MSGVGPKFLFSTISRMKKDDFINTLMKHNGKMNIVIDYIKSSALSHTIYYDNIHRILAEILNICHHLDKKIQLQMVSDISNNLDEFLVIKPDHIGYDWKSIRHYKCSTNMVLHKHIAVGGTFDRMHFGHILLLSSAIMLCDNSIVHVGLTTDSYVSDSKYLSEMIQPYEYRKKMIEEFFKFFQGVSCSVIPLNDRFGLTINSEYLTALIMTSENEDCIDKIEKIRKLNGLASLNYYIIDNMIQPKESLIHIINADKLSSSLLRFNELGQLIKQPNAYDGKLPYLIGMTGCIASGKSSICSRFKKKAESYGWSVTVIDCDKLAHQSYKYGSPCYYELIKNFSNDNIIDPNTHEINRSILGEIIFNNETKRKCLNNIVWKYTRQLMLDEVKKCSTNICMIEAAFIIESGNKSLFNEIWVSWINEKEAVKRILKRNGNLIDESLAIKKFKASQILMNNKEKITHAHLLISTIYDEMITELIIDKICIEHKPIFEHINFN